MKTPGRKKRNKGFIRMDATKEVYQICEVHINKKEIILSVLTPTVLQLI
ncbi:hypothetical protein FK220_004465 [Flavobacteriaceae bacterium TP-CH-4]|uniref:Uncharacterized protein n=1 Tax=Pelagihabitans pacificus TaxID=2696054 RepID=A0A967ECS0_9FLAO|nr:hypothetical protein [Pelagihabitans pacificus]NHF58578.1 hypothetical protein [Pelagihabitans pacificus]